MKIEKFELDSNIDIKNIKTGDMPGDKVQINDKHIEKSLIIAERLQELLMENDNEKVVISIYGGSGVGKSETGSLLGAILKYNGIESYILSGDNYPHRIPMLNDKKREEVYAEGGYDALVNYLGTSNEIDFDKVNDIIRQFKAGEKTISLKRMGRTKDQLWYDDVNFEGIKVLIIEWTHGNNENLVGIDIPILLNSTPEETLAHRKSRNRDGGVDSPFVQKVLEIEQNKIIKQTKTAKIIMTKSGEIISYNEFKRLMDNE